MNTGNATSTLVWATNEPTLGSNVPFQCRGTNTSTNGHVVQSTSDIVNNLDIVNFPLLTEYLLHKNVRYSQAQLCPPLI